MGNIWWQEFGLFDAFQPAHALIQKGLDSEEAMSGGIDGPDHCLGICCEERSILTVDSLLL